MNDSNPKVKHLKIGSGATVYDFYDVDAHSGGGGVADSYVYINASGNLEVSSNPAKPASPVTPAADCKLNLVSKGEIQIKPGQDGAADKAATVQVDCEAAAQATEVPFKICNGSLPKASRVVDTKWNTAKWVFDTQKSNLEDKTDFIMQWRLDKWNSGQPASDKGPISVKLKGKSFDIRCHGDQPGGGVAIQPSGRDSNGKENKIKFESSRQCVLDNPTTVTYGAEGGKGLEFGTFNNLHSSLYTQDYRFRANAPLYAVVRGVPTLVSDKFDYPTQTDDFKDILPSETAINWADVINVVRYVKTLSEYATWLSTNKLTVAGVGVDGFDSNNMKHPTHTVTFSCTNGSVAATVDGTAITSGDSVIEGKSVVFTITPAEGYEYTGTNPETVVVSAAVTKTYECTPVTP